MEGVTFPPLSLDRQTHFYSQDKIGLDKRRLEGLMGQKSREVQLSELVEKDGQSSFEKTLKC